MNAKTQALWDAVLRLIEKNVSEQQFDTWFKPIVIESFNETTREVLVQISSQYVYEYLEENYAELWKKVLTSVFGAGVCLNYRIVADKAHDKTIVLPSDPVEAVGVKKGRGSVENPVLPVSNDVAVQELDPNLDPHMSFETFIEGDSNKLPRSIGLSIAEHPNTTQFNPMFIYGPSGCGKTHLINAIGLRIKQLYPKKRVLYISARLFQVQYTNSVLNNTTNDFINFYQTIDVLIVDDIQEWATATKTQDTFFHIFNHLFRNGKRIVLASDRPPVDLKGMNERLLTRFACGLIAELEKPNVQLCVDILHNKIKRDGLQISETVIQFIAQTANGSVRDLEGTINSLLAYSVVYNCNIDMRLAERIVRRAVKIDDEPLTIDDIIETVCKHYNVSTKSVSSRSRKREFVVARQVAMFMAQKYTKMPASRIGKLVGGRDHSTVIHSCSQVEKRLQVDKVFADDLLSIENSFKLKN